MKKIVSLFILLVSVQLCMAQTEVIQFIKAGAADANKLFKPYLQPYAHALGDGLNNGWYQTAETHHLLGFDVSANISAVQIPGSDTSFDLKSIDFSNLTVVGSNTITPTIAGSKAERPTLIVKDNNQHQLASFKSPGGVNLDLVPVPVLQLSLGVLPNTDLIIRALPGFNVKLADDRARIGMIGGGIKHNILKTIPGLKHLPLDASLFVGYSKITAESNINFTPTDYGLSNVSVTFTNVDNQKLKIGTSNIKFGLIISKKLGPLTFFGSLAETSSKTTVDLVGKYPVVTALSNGNLVITNEDALVDPIALEFKSSNFSMDFGARLKLAFFSFYGSINKAEYTSYNAGVAFGFR